ncbi:MAG TPA: hypothetical protein VIK65_12760 [Candidatus Limnocylindrales bacterium]|jgi:hypothetical protein
MTGADRTPGLREALLVGGAAVLVVLAASVITFLLPQGARDVVFRTPLLILVLIVGTAGVLWRITRPGGGTR